LRKQKSRNIRFGFSSVLKTGLSCAESQNQHFEKSRRHYTACLLFP
jgi:hypothetical protein